ncbi:MAG: hypothetical protein WAS27_02285 [Candidatus Saccharimonadales bacterium]
MASSKKATTPVPAYNPFFVTLQGITNVFTYAFSVGMTILLIGVVGSIVSWVISPDKQSQSTGAATIDPQQLPLLITVIAIVIVFSLVVGAMLHGIQSYAALRVSRSEKTTITEAFNVVLGQFGGYLMLYIWMHVKIFLWSLLLIIPGIIAYYRYSFAGVVFFDKELRGDAAIKESNRLTKDGLMTIFGSQTLFNIMTFGVMSGVVTLASTSELYREYTALDAANRSKPAAHWLSWFCIALPFIVIGLALLFILAIVIVVGVTGALLTR